ncbi:hypothetical protein OPV22_034062 [Ensete ventricosum]|uniref:pyruvate kinase n=1 Tax=Ensete ventricosum TaxID=4639 RepID=A0AAV8P3X8_ENSVE|nr:hypothetical protein OPV22_034062 [Ensete ventricosum]
MAEDEDRVHSGAGFEVRGDDRAAPKSGHERGPLQLLSHEYHQETLHNLRAAMERPDGKPSQLKKGQELIVSTDYGIRGDEKMISMSYNKLADDLKPDGVILCADGTIMLTVLACDSSSGLVRCRCENSALLGERKNVNLPGVVVDLPTLTEKDKEDILRWGVPNKIDIIALSFVRKERIRRCRSQEAARRPCEVHHGREPRRRG